ncbi:PD-(D/E)XK nuclease family protein [Desulfurispira natronophila]|uniref:RecB family exonuclease n=1 Tax=Desulfurispira natronophila TaxID=682562 RepID=A0A7W7Y3D3_9BACT|nr:PD-(D/E)XK nuclease family protein [Desulfurispira natronophila]MBB5021356.1 RecB family exonuclease [Desulfurispira natronophila]
MNIVFGTYLDSLTWSDKPAAIGELRLGPMGMLGLLETRLGLTGNYVHPARRISQYLQRMQSIDNPGAWFHRSFSADPWSTAKQMLSWRDTLVASGWQDTALPSTSARLQALGDIEAVDLPLSAGREDRLQSIALSLKSGIPAHIETLTLSEPRSILPAIWQQILALLAGQGTHIVESAVPAPQGTTTNLSAIQHALGSLNPPHIDTGDDSLLLISAETEWDAAETLARYLASAPADNSTTTLICQGSSDILDQALQRHGLPQIGASSDSPWRTALQILPLVIANCWEPVDVNRLVELLSLPSPPIRYFAARHLLSALASEPGVGGEAWKNAMEKIGSDYQTKVLDQASGNRKLPSAAEYVQQLEAFLHTERFDPATGIPYRALEERCQWLMEFLGAYADRDSLMAEALSQTSELLHVSASMNHIPRITLERMLDSVIGVGASNPLVQSHAAAYQVVHTPGQVLSPTSTTIWWNFTSNHSGSAAWWSSQERQSLAESGIILEETSAHSLRESRSWQLALQNTSKRLLLFAPRQICGETAYPHPFWDEIRSVALCGENHSHEEAILTALTRHEHQLQQQGRWSLAERRMSLTALSTADLPEPEESCTVQAGAIALGKHLSYSQMSMLIGCPMNWTLKYHAGLRAADAHSLPTGNQMIGSLCHRIVELLYAEPVKQWKPDKAAQKARELFHELTRSMAAELLLEGHEVEIRRYERAIVEAVRKLVDAICRLNLKVEEAERKLEGTLQGTPFIGFADLILRTPAGEPFVLDLKWSYATKYRKEEIEQGSALQLATYNWLMASEEPNTHTGYFLLAQGELLSDSPLLGDEALPSAVPLDTTWQMGQLSFVQSLQGLQSGRVEARGILERKLLENSDVDKLDKLQSERREEMARNKMLYIKPPCGYCDYATLCGMGGSL